MCMSVKVCACECSTCRGQERALDPLELELQANMVADELEPSARAVLALQQDISPAPGFLIFKNYRCRT